LLLAIIQAVNQLYDLGLSRTVIQTLSGRGGTSGIGINAFFEGGFLVDGGHAQQLPGLHSPSSSRRPSQVPPVMYRCDIPSRWRFCLFLPDVLGASQLSGVAEESFFKRNTPIPAAEVFETVAIAYHGIAPAVRDGDLNTLSHGLARLQQLGFKRREIDGRGVSVTALLQSLASIPECASGMSSVGPLVYAIVDEARSSALAGVLAQYSSRARLLTTAGPRNSGFTILG
jgi:beta-ribofuranosylaminobenzene 5'-phosphate synthase